jgi:hypothetical protein
VFAAGEIVNVASLVGTTIANTPPPVSTTPASVITANATTVNPVTGVVGITGTYNVGISNGVQVGSSTAPILVNGSNTTTAGAANKANGNLTINFGSYQVNYNIDVPTTSNGTFNLQGNGSLLAAGTFATTGTVSHSGRGNPCNSGGAGGCSGALAGGNLVEGGLSGTTAQKVDLRYGIVAPAINGSVYGNIVLQ